MKKFDKDITKFIEKEKNQTDPFKYRFKILYGTEIVLKEKLDGTPVEKLVVGNTKLAQEVAEILNKNSKKTIKSKKGKKIINSSRIDDIVKHYAIASLWSSNDDQGDPLDSNYSLSDIDNATMASMKKDVTKFVNENMDDLNESGLSDEQIGHDFWLTRNGHGAGFWDREIPKEVATNLTDASKEFKGYDLYVDDGKVKAEHYQKGGRVKKSKDGDTHSYFVVPFKTKKEYEEKKISSRDKSFINWDVASETQDKMIDSGKFYAVGIYAYKGGREVSIGFGGEYKKGGSVLNSIQQYFANHGATIFGGYFKSYSNKKMCGGKMKNGGTLEESEESEEEKRAYIASLIRKGNTSGYSPSWKLETEIFEDGFEMGDGDTEHVATLVEQGYSEGELVVANEKEEESRGWWKIKIY